MVWPRLLLAFLWAAVVALPLPGAPPARAARPGDQGLQGGWAVGDLGDTIFPHSLSTQYPIIREAGAGWVRVNFRLGGCYQDWTTHSPCNDRTALEAYDEVVQAAQANNLRVVGLFSNESWHGDQAEWTANNAETGSGSGDNTYVREFAEKAVRRVVNRYRDRIDHWEIWNEPNAWTELDAEGMPTGGSFIFPSNFAWLLRRSHAEIKAAQPTSGTLISGGLFGHDLGGLTITTIEDRRRRRVTKRGTVRGTGLERRPAGVIGAETAAATGCESVPSGADYLCSTYEMGRRRAGWDQYRAQTGRYPLDHIGQHLYVDQGGATSGEKLRRYLQELRNAYLRYEGAGTAKTIQVTEFGWQTAPGYVTPEIQARNLEVAYETFGATSYVGRAFWFSIQDIPEGGIFHGLVDTDGAKKPAFEAYRAAAAAPGPAPGPAPVPPGSCSPRPNVQVSVVRAGAGRLQVTVSVGTPATRPGNRLRALRFGAATNALIDVGDRVGLAGNVTVDLAAGSAATFFVRRADPRLATTVPLVVIDDCGEWPTFVGGGPAAF